MIRGIIQYMAALTIGAAASYTYGVYQAEQNKPPHVNPVPIQKVESHNLEYNGPYSRLSKVNQTNEQRRCLALNIYHEAKNQSERGMRAVALVTLNRVMSNRYPDTICDVVKQARRDINGNIIKHKCQFSWFCNGLSDDPHDENSWLTVKQISDSIINNPGSQVDYTNGSLWYHASYVNPYWSNNFQKVAQIEDHIFYKEK